MWAVTEGLGKVMSVAGVLLTIKCNVSLAKDPSSEGIAILRVFKAVTSSEQSCSSGGASLFVRRALLQSTLRVFYYSAR